MIKKILNFGIVGILATIIDFSVLFTLKSVLNLNIYMATFIAFNISLIFNFIASMKYVFVARNGLSKKKQIIIFVITSIIGLCINQVIMYVGVGMLHMFYIGSKVIATAITMIFNFVTRQNFIEEKKDG